MLVYAAISSAAVWFWGVPWTRARSAGSGLMPGELHERLGRTDGLPADLRPILIHAVSAGEMSAARALVDAIVDRDPHVRIILTMGTGDGRLLAERMREDVPQIVACRFLPWDRPRVVRRWLAYCHPRAVVVVETELWPGLFSACRCLGIPLYLVSARLYPRDVHRYQWLGRWWSTIMALPTKVLVQDAHEATAFLAIGTPPDRLDVGGNLKFDAVRPRINEARKAAVLTIVAGSTHAPEDTWILDAVTRLQGAGIPCALTLAPRDVRRAAAIRRLASTVGASDVTVLDRMGTLAAAYDGAHIVVCGGSFAAFGGHNIIEPAAAGCAIVVGPHVAHIQAHVEQLEAAGAVVRLHPAADPAASLAAILTALHHDRARLEAIGRRAQAWCANHGGAAVRAARLVLPLAPPHNLRGSQ